MSVPYQAPARPLFGTPAEDYIDEVIACVPARVDKQRIEMELRSRLSPDLSIEQAIATYGQPRDLAEFYLASVPLESAPFLRRLAAALIDVPSVLLAGIAIFYAAWKLFGPSDKTFIASVVMENPLATVFAFAALMMMSPAYYIISETLTSQTIGKALMGLRTVRESGAKITVGQAMVRQIPLFFSAFYVPDAIFVLFTQKRQRLVELITKTRVVRT